jgi:agmatinase
MFDLQYMVASGEIAYDSDHPSFSQHLLPPSKSEGADVALVGIPYAGGTFRLVGTNLGPVGVRKGLGYFRSYSTELEIDINDYLKIVDLGNLDVVWNNAQETFRRVDALVKAILHAGLRPAIIGGDHSISQQIIKTFCLEKQEAVGIIWVDNHLDSMSDYQGDANYCGCPLYNIVKELPDYVHPQNVVHIGSRGFHNSPLMWKNARDMGIHIIKADDVQIRGVQSVVDEALQRAQDGTTKLYLTFDIDVGEGVFTPGTQCPRPGGLYPWQMLYIVRRIAQAGADGFDLMEVAPTVDVSDATIMLAASLVLEFFAGLAWRKSRGNK